MNDPFRLRVLKALTETLEAISTANGYQHDLNGKVFRGRAVFGNSDPLPMISILEAISPQSESGMAPTDGQQIENWELLIQGFVEDDEQNPTDPAYYLLADVKQCLSDARSMRDPATQARNILGMGNRVSELRFSQGVVRPADEVSDKAYFWLTLEIKAVEDHARPFV